MEQRDGQRGPQAGLPTCTVVVPTRNRLPHLERVLEAVAEQDHKPSEVVVVDSAPTVAGAQDVASRWGARYVLEPLPGASRARNSGAAQSQSEIVVFLDDDALPEPDWLRHLLVEFSEPDVCVVTGCVLPWSKGGASGVQAATVRGAGLDGRFGGDERLVVDRKSPGWFELCAFGGFGIAANMAVRRSAFQRVGGFDPLLGPGAPLLLSEEYYLYFALVRLGYRGVYTPKAVVSHPYLALEEDWGRRYLASRTAGSAFMAFLLARHPKHAPTILKYIVRRLSGQRSPWGRPGFLPRPPGVSRWQVLKAILAAKIRTPGWIHNQPIRSSSASIAVAICTKDRPDKLRRCLQSLVPLRSQLLQLIVVDNNSATEETRTVAEEHGTLYLREDRPGLFAARNCALRHCRADILAFTDDDCEADPGWIAGILGGFGDQDVACVTGRAISPPGKGNWLQKQFDAQSRGFCKPFPYQVTPERPRGIFHRAFVGVGANMAFRRDVLLQLNGFPDRLTGDAGDDNYMFYRILSMGWKIQYMPDSLVYEEHRSQFGDVLRRSFQYGASNVQTMAEISLQQAAYSFLNKNVLWMPLSMLYSWQYSVRRRADTIAGLVFQLVSMLFFVGGMTWEFPFALWRLGHNLSLRAQGQVPEGKGLGG